MVIDTSAILAILLDEAEAEDFLVRIERDPVRLLSVASYVEAAIIIDDRFGVEGGRDLKLFLAEAGIEIEPMTIAQADLAREAYRRFGRGNHPACLNFGDCFAYALAKAAREPILYKGNDFGQTDIPAA